MPDPDPWSLVRPGDASDPRVQKALAKQMERNTHVGRTAASVAGLIDMAGPPQWDRDAWEQIKARTGEYPFSQSEQPPDPRWVETAPAWAYVLMGMRPPLMAQ